MAGRSISNADNAPLQDHERNILDNIEEHGWFGTHVFDPELTTPNFSYTVGFAETFAAAEFIAFGLPSKLTHSMLWEMFHQIQSGKAPSDNMRWSNLIEGHDCISRAVHPTNMDRDYFSSAIWYSKQEGEPAPLSAFQPVWPGKLDGLFPWDESCSGVVRDGQPALYLPHRSLS